MCGIFGKINHQNDALPDLLEQMRKSLAHRGPDDSGTHIESYQNGFMGLGHTRLSVMDLSNSGREPMCNEDKNLWLVFNGEIYNHYPLRRECESRGHHFSSKTDCEVILHLYEDEGIDCLQRLNGMFSFALWNNQNQTLVLARDRIGIKPLVYHWNETSLTFASEIRALNCDPDVKRSMNWSALNLYLSFNYIPAPETIFSDIKKLPPGHYLTLKRHSIDIKPYWNITSNSTTNPDVADIHTYQNRLQQLLEDAVRIRLMSDVPLGAFLSGGIDSSIIVALMAKLSSNPIKTFSIGYKDMPMFDETSSARALAKMYQTDHHEIRLSSQDLIKTIPNLLHHFDEPFADSSAIPTFMVSQATRQHVTVALSGDGGDELFAGYRMYSGERWFHQYCKIPSPLRHHLIEPFIKTLPESRDHQSLEQIRRIKKFIRGANNTFEQRFFLWNQIFSRDIRQSLLKNADIDFDLGQTLFSSHLNHLTGDPINRMLYTDLKHSLPNDMLTKVDGMSMKNSLEVRVPLLDHRVVELAFQIPGHLKMHRSQGKYIFREAFRSLLPASLMKKPKWGFEVPISQWLKTDLRFLIEDHLSTSHIKRQGIFDEPTITRIKKQFFSNHSDTAWQLWSLIVFQAWYERFN